VKAKAILLIFLLVPPSPLFSQQKAVFVFNDLTVRAWTLDKTEEKIVAAGEVEVIYKQVKLFADRIELDTKTKDVLATGKVTLQLPEEVVDCEKLSFNLDTQQGKLDKAIGRIQPSVAYEAAAIERKADNLYELEKAKFTSCSQPTPRWNFSFSKAEFKKNDYVAMRGAVLSIKKVPIFYWPYLRYPLDKSKRTTGFLMPKIGYSGVKGFTISQGFYWAIARNMDASFSLDYYGAKGIGAGMEYRYLFSAISGGDINLYYFTYKTPAPVTSDTGVVTQPIKPDDAYIVRWNHNQTLPLGFTLVARVDYQSSYNFLKEFDNNFMRALMYVRSSEVYLSKSFSPFNFNARAARIETGSSVGSYSVVYTYLPQVNFDSFKMKVFSPLYFSFSSSFSNWQYGSDMQYKKNTQARNKQFEFSPVLSLPFNAIPWLSMNFSAAGFFNYYWKSRDAAGAIVDVPVLTRNFAVGVDFTGPVFYRIWELGGDEASGGSAKPLLKHIFEPDFGYRFESPIINGIKVYSPFPLYRYHQIDYGFTNHILLKRKDQSPKEIFTWGISQTFYLSPEESPNKNYPINGVIPKFSEISSYIRLYPAPGYSFDFAASYNTYFTSFSSIRLGTNLGTPADDFFININWYKSINPYEKNYIFNRHQISSYAGWKLPSLSLELEGEIDFNITEGKMLYSAAGITYHYQCLDLKADVALFFFREKPEFRFNISFGLGNIGKTTDFLGGARFN